MDSNETSPTSVSSKTTAGLPGASENGSPPGLMRTGSYLNAFFKGRQRGEFTWFSLGSSLPLISMDAQRAARQIVEATRRGQAERVLSLPALALAWFHGLFPGLTADILSLADRVLLPAADGAGPEAAERVPGER
jgi:hypothetical protein